MRKRDNERAREREIERERESQREIMKNRIRKIIKKRIKMEREGRKIKIKKKKEESIGSDLYGEKRVRNIEE